MECPAGEDEDPVGGEVAVRFVIVVHDQHHPPQPLSAAVTIPA
jgi:hypothetical protein